MGSSILNWISRKRASLRSISAGIFGSPNSYSDAVFRSPNLCSDSKSGARMFSTSTRISISAGISRSPNLWSGSKVGARMFSSSTRTSFSPWLMLSPATEGGDNKIYKFYKLAENEEKSYAKSNRGGGNESLDNDGIESPENDAKIVGSSNGWLALLNTSNYELFLSNPLTDRHIKLPPIHNLPIHHLQSNSVTKVIMSCSPDEEECRAMMIFGSDSRMAFCSPGRSSWWTPIGSQYDEITGLHRSYADFVYSSTQKLFYCITNPTVPGQVEAWDLSDLGSPRLDWMVRDDDPFLYLDYSSPKPSEEELERRKFCMKLKYLVFAEQANDLFLVVRYVNLRMRTDGTFVKFIYWGPTRGWDSSYPRKTIDFEVYKIVREGQGGSLRHMDNHLDGLVMFVGGNHSFAVSAVSDEFNANSIYFTDENRLMWEIFSPRFGGHDNGVFNYEKKTFSSFHPHYTCDYQSIRRIAPPPEYLDNRRTSLFCRNT